MFNVLSAVWETNAYPLANTSAFWAGGVENWLGRVEFFIEYKGHLFSGECSKNFVSHIEVSWKATREMNTKVTHEWVHNQFIIIH